MFGKKVAQPVVSLFVKDGKSGAFVYVDSTEVVQGDSDPEFFKTFVIKQYEEEQPEAKLVITDVKDIAQHNRWKQVLSEPTKKSKKGGDKKDQENILNASWRAAAEGSEVPRPPLPLTPALANRLPMPLTRLCLIIALASHLSFRRRLWV
jgi:hypothetical protein